ncbi:MAG: glycosyltransferase family 4 protein [Flavobacteriaceae bacterium]|nr:glycosyltransferase family 4 protein [Flavobacteriaceae bacterium]
MKNTNKILLVTSEFPPLPGGIGNHAYNLAKYLRANDFEVKVISDQRNNNNEIEKKFDKEQKFSVVRTRKKKLRPFMYFDRILKIKKEVSNNSIIIASGKFSLWAVALASFFYKRKYIAILHGTEVNFKNSLLNKSISISLKRFQKIITVSSYTKSLINHLQLKNVEVIPNGFEKFNEAVSASDLMKKKGLPSLITVGSVTERKGQLNVIDALPNLIKKYPEIHYHIVGTPYQKEEFLEIAKKINVDKYITFHGIITDEEKIALLKSSDIFVMLSQNTVKGDVEGFGIALLEANSIGLPTIGAKNCGIEDAILNNKSGILIDNKNHLEFSNAIQKIIDNYELFSNEALTWSSKFTWDIIIKKYMNTLNS